MNRFAALDSDDEVPTQKVASKKVVAPAAAAAPAAKAAAPTKEAAPAKKGKQNATMIILLFYLLM